MVGDREGVCGEGKEEVGWWGIGEEVGWWGIEKECVVRGRRR